MKEVFLGSEEELFFMGAFDLTRLIICSVLIGAFIIYFLIKLFFKKNPFTTKFIANTAIFAALSIILYIVPYFQFPLFFMPSFLELHFDEIPSLIAGFAYGPLSGFITVLVKTLVKLPMTKTLGVGELADFIYSIAFVIPASLIYKKRRTFKGACLGLTLGVVFQLVASSFITSFLILDFYISVMGLSKEIIIAMCKAANPKVTSLGWTFFFYVALPFNMIKDLVVGLLTILLYKKLHVLIDKIEYKKN